MKELNENNFTETINEGICVVDFWASWCGPCKMLTPILEQISDNLPMINFYKVNVDDNSDLAMQYNIRSLPTIMVFKNGTPTNQMVGFPGKDKLLEFIKKETM